MTMMEVIKKMEERGISTMSLSYLQQLRKGEANNPRLQHLRALADVFGVPLSYLTEDETPSGPTESDLTSEERKVALRVHGLSEEALSNIRSIVELARKSEQLDAPAKPSPKGETASEG